MVRFFAQNAWHGGPAPSTTSNLSTQSNTEIIQNSIRKDNGFQISLTFQEGLSDANKQFVRQAAQILVDVFTNPITHLVSISDMNTGLGESITPLVTFSSYTAYRNDYPGSTNAIRSTILTNNMPVSDPLSGTHTYFATLTQTLAWGLKISNTASQIKINFSQSGTYDMVGVALHELTETMGRLGGFDENSTTFTSIGSLCTFDSAGSRGAPYDVGAYYSTNQGTDNVSFFNSDVSGDSFDWSGVTLKTDCCNAFATPKATESLSVQDLLVMQGAGYNLSGIVYSSNPLVFQIGQATTKKNNFQRILNITSFSIAPTLPSNLSFSVTDGTISGVPQETLPLLSFSTALTSNYVNVTGDVGIQVNSGGGALSAGAIAGIVIGSVAFVVILVLIAVYATRKKTK